MEPYLFEVCANSVESCLAAQAGGANRVELCAGIPEGGTTPSFGDIATAREVLKETRLHVIIRPRGGDFLYSSLEQRIMLQDVENARRLGADGVVFGCLGAVMALVTFILWRRMEHKAPIQVSGKMILSIAVGILGALMLGVGMCFSMVWGRLVAGIGIGLLGIVILLCLIPLTRGLED